MLNHYYVTIVRKNVKDLKNFNKFLPVFEYFCDKKGISNFWQIEEFINEFFNNPHSIDFSKYEDKKRATVVFSKKIRNEYKEKYCFINRQYQTLCQF